MSHFPAFVFPQFASPLFSSLIILYRVSNFRSISFPVDAEIPWGLFIVDGGLILERRVRIYALLRIEGRWWSGLVLGGGDCLHSVLACMRLR
jgi:hypothetical protein